MVFSHPEFDQHEQVLFCSDASVGLTAIVAIHSTALGPAAGGCRMHPYASEADALCDVLRLSKGMSYKNAVAGLPLGGGKSVIIGDPQSAQKPALLRAFAKHIQNLNGQYWTAIDIGVGPKDADVMAESCDFIFARAQQYEEGFNPSSFTALGGFMGIKAAAKHVWARDDLTGLRVAIQGAGATGAGLAAHLNEAGASIVIADVRDETVREVAAKYGAEIANPEDIHRADVDILAPCAMGATMNDETIPELKAKAICGLANNQLAEARHCMALQDRGIAYVPDYVVNAGGVMGASTVIFGEVDREASLKRIHGLEGTILELLSTAAKTGRTSAEIADKMALSRIHQAG